MARILTGPHARPPAADGLSGEPFHDDCSRAARDLDDGVRIPDLDLPDLAPRNAGVVADAGEHIAGPQPVTRAHVEKESHHSVARRGGRSVGGGARLVALLFP